MLLWELIERERSSERQNKGEEREREIPTGHEESISTHIHGTNSRGIFFFIFYYLWSVLFYIIGWIVRKKTPGSHAIRSQTLTWTRYQGCEAARMCLESTSLT